MSRRRALTFPKSFSMFSFELNSASLQKAMGLSERTWLLFLNIPFSSWLKPCLLKGGVLIRDQRHIILLALTLLPNSPKYVFLKNKLSWNNLVWMLLNCSEEYYSDLTFETKLTFPRARHLYSRINVLACRVILQLLCTLNLVSL